MVLYLDNWHFQVLDSNLEQFLFLIFCWREKKVWMIPTTPLTLSERFEPIAPQLEDGRAAQSLLHTGHLVTRFPWNRCARQFLWGGCVIYEAFFKIPSTSDAFKLQTRWLKDTSAPIGLVTTPLTWYQQGPISTLHSMKLSLTRPHLPSLKRLHAQTPLLRWICALASALLLPLTAFDKCSL